MGNPEMQLKVGQQVVFESTGPQTPWCTVFEDDGETGYFYAVDRSRPEEPEILDALHVYSVGAVQDREAIYPVEIRWSADGGRAGLYIEEYPHAVFDFVQHRGYCRTNFPSSSRWSEQGHEWSDDALVGL